MEKTPSSVSMGRRRCEMTWMPEKARDWSGIEERFPASLPDAVGAGEMRVFLLSIRRPRS